MGEMRLQKYLAAAGLGSRRACEELIRAGRVMVNGTVAQLGASVDEGDMVELDGKPFQFFASNREKWAVETCYVYPGAIQYIGPSQVCDTTTVTLALEQG